MMPAIFILSFMALLLFIGLRAEGDRD
jgi:hypothetical protein